MNKLPVNPAASVRYHQICKMYCLKILARADIFARERNGNSIETGDFDQALQYFEKRDNRAQIILIVASAAVGASVSGVLQNLLDHKSPIYIGSFVVMGLFGLITAHNVLSRK
jgi:hypothetical protein